MLHELCGDVDVLVNNAGIAWCGLLSDMKEDEWDRLFEVNVKGCFNCIKEFSPHMVREKSGSVVNISSMWGITGGSCEVAYSATKAAVIGLTKALAKELGPSGVRVNCVAPGVIKTDMISNLSEDEMKPMTEKKMISIDTLWRGLGFGIIMEWTVEKMWQKRLSTFARLNL